MTNPLGMQKLLGIEEEMDIYSAGILLFYMKTGKTPFDEDGQTKVHDYRALFEVFNEYHWQVFKEIHKLDVEMDVDMRRLIQRMCMKEAKDRCSFKEIKESKFYQGEVFETD